MDGIFSSSPVYTNKELTSANYRHGHSNSKLLLFARQNLQLLKYDIQSANVIQTRRFVISNYISSLAALLEDRVLLFELGNEFKNRKQSIQSKKEKELMEIKDSLDAQEREQNSILLEIEQRAKKEEKKSEKMSDLEMRYYQEQAEYELFKESERVRKEYEKECQTLKELKEEQQNTNIIKAKLDSIKMKKPSSSNMPSPYNASIPSPRIAYQISQNKKKTKK